MAQFPVELNLVMLLGFSEPNDECSASGSAHAHIIPVNTATVKSSPPMMRRHKNSQADQYLCNRLLGKPCIADVDSRIGRQEYSSVRWTSQAKLFGSKPLEIQIEITGAMSQMGGDFVWARLRREVADL